MKFPPTGISLRFAKWPLALTLLLGVSGAGLGGCEGGTSSETVGFEPNEVEVTLEANSIKGRSGKGNAVSLFAIEFQPQLDSGFRQDIAPDSQGHFHFSDLPPGHYRLMVQNPLSEKATLLDSLVLPSPALVARRAVMLATGTLTGVLIRSSIDNPNADSLPSQSGFFGMVYAPGTPFFTLSDSLGRYSLTGIPAGRYRFIKAWKPICQAGRICGEIPGPGDSTELEIQSGENVTW
jgi:hypothetical protein